MTYSLVTVVHKPDYALLRLQARSLARYLPPDFTNEIYVIANQGLTGSDEWKQPLLSDYGLFADRVHFLDASEVVAIPGELSGWYSQQLLKLMIARFLSSDRYMVLDAKNHLVFPLSPEFYENRDRIRLRDTNYGQAWRPQLESALRCFGIDGDDIKRSFLPTITPFIFPTREVIALIENVARLERMPFPLAFSNLGTTEFLLFGAFLCSLPGGIGRFYDMSGQRCPTIWPNTARDGHEVVEHETSRVEHQRLPFFTVHRDAFPLLDARSKEAIATVWVGRHLFDSFEQARRFINIFDSFGPALRFV